MIGMQDSEKVAVSNKMAPEGKGSCKYVRLLLLGR